MTIFEMNDEEIELRIINNAYKWLEIGYSLGYLTEKEYKEKHSDVSNNPDKYREAFLNLSIDNILEDDR
jgi:hypothetical protein